MPEAETPKPESKPSKTLYVIPPLRKKRAETPVPRAKKVTAKAPPPEPKAPPEPKQTAGSGSKRYPHVLNEPPKAKASPPEPKAKAPPPAPKAKAPPPPPAKRAEEGGVQKITGQTEAWWRRQGMGILKDQAQLRGRKFTDREIKGDRAQGIPRFMKEDYLRVMLELLKKEQ